MWVIIVIMIIFTVPSVRCGIIHNKNKKRRKIFNDRKFPDKRSEKTKK